MTARRLANVVPASSLTPARALAGDGDFAAARDVARPRRTVEEGPRVEGDLVAQHVP